MIRHKQFLFGACVVLAATAIACAAAASQLAPLPEPTTDRPLIEVDLHKFGYRDENARNVDKAGTTRKRFLDFTDNNSLIWAWWTLDTAIVYSKKGPFPPLQPQTFHAFVLDAKTGVDKAKQEWPTEKAPIWLIPVRDGKLITCDKDKIHLYSMGFEHLKELELPEPGDCWGVSSLREGGRSPSRRSILISNFSDPANQLRVLDTVTFSLSSTLEGDTSLTPMSISDLWFIKKCGKQTDICIRMWDEPWHAVQFTGMSEPFKVSFLLQPAFVNEDTVAVFDENTLTFAKAEGAMVFQEKLPKGHMFSSYLPAASRESDRFAVMETRQRGITYDIFDMSAYQANDEIVVFSLSERRAIFVLKVNGDSPWPPFTSHHNTFALSPDGNLLAVVSDGILRVYKLPATKNP
jgi:hypothetical protein